MAEFPKPPPVKRVYTIKKSSKPRGEIYRLKGGDSILVTILSPTFWGVTIHFDERSRRSMGCRGNPEQCEGCLGKIPVKDLFYLFCWFGPGRTGHVELTPRAMGQLDEAMQGKGTYRGQRVKVFRTKANNGRLNIEVYERIDKPESLQPDEDPTELLEWLWAYRRFK